ncbi:MAG: hypothetical protein E6661_04650 [Enterobacter sp.]|uniref:hypothetical protein n=1 Tax=Enterobacter TaxID=547 RepID=UPI000573E4CC|nr:MULTISPECIES: hypothetical protein [Enterobacter]OIR49782.1 hypothetical protein BH716_14215 [Lelliottia nimipressuralis]KHO35103.1 hypothetical protein PI91_14045 [Enterobacter sp. FB]MCU4024304.1 hypothetical protein [Enterobacter roggenkampii]MDU6057638.1 hypothetical protein [Enterobacter sp.]OEH01445.1 hypothetical protein AN685_0203870 [Enterobacter roggenkampii]
MRDFEMHGRGHGRGFGRHRMGKGLVIGAVIFIVLGLLVMSLWNALLPAILGVKAIGFWQALGILVLSRILFGGLGFRPGMFGAHRRMHERWMNMTPEQREAFIQQRREGFGRHGRGHCGWHDHRDDKRDDATPKAPDAE